MTLADLEKDAERRLGNIDIAQQFKLVEFEVYCKTLDNFAHVALDISPMPESRYTLSNLSMVNENAQKILQADVLKGITAIIEQSPFGKTSISAGKFKEDFLLLANGIQEMYEGPEGIYRIFLKTRKGQNIIFENLASFKKTAQERLGSLGNIAHEVVSVNFQVHYEQSGKFAQVSLKINSMPSAATYMNIDKVEMRDFVRQDRLERDIRNAIAQILARGSSSVITADQALQKAKSFIREGRVTMGHTMRSAELIPKSFRDDVIEILPDELLGYNLEDFEKVFDKLVAVQITFWEKGDKNNSVTVKLDLGPNTSGEFVEVLKSSSTLAGQEDRVEGYRPDPSEELSRIVDPQSPDLPEGHRAALEEPAYDFENGEQVDASYKNPGGKAGSSLTADQAFRKIQDFIQANTTDSYFTNMLTMKILDKEGAVLKEILPKDFYLFQDPTRFRDLYYKIYAAEITYLEKGDKNNSVTVNLDLGPNTSGEFVEVLKSSSTLAGQEDRVEGYRPDPSEELSRIVDPQSPDLPEGHRAALEEPAYDFENGETADENYNAQGTSSALATPEQFRDDLIEFLEKAEIRSEDVSQLILNEKGGGGVIDNIWQDDVLGEFKKSVVNVFRVVHGQKDIEILGTITILLRNLFKVEISLNKGRIISVTVYDLGRRATLYEGLPKNESFQQKVDDARQGLSGGNIFSVNFNPGGILMSSENLDLQIKRDGSGIPLPISQQPIESMNIQGFSFEIIGITPVPSLFLLSGLEDMDTGNSVSQKISQAIGDAVVADRKELSYKL